MNSKKRTDKERRLHAEYVYRRRHRPCCKSCGFILDETDDEYKEYKDGICVWCHNRSLYGVKIDYDGGELPSGLNLMIPWYEIGDGGGHYGKTWRDG